MNIDEMHARPGDTCMYRGHNNLQAIKDVQKYVNYGN